MNRRKAIYTVVYWPAALLLLWVLPSCDRKLDLPDIEGKKTIALLGELVAGDSFNLRAGKSVPLASESNLQFEILRGISIYVNDGQSNIQLTGVEDSAAKTLFTIPFSSPEKVKPNHSYNIIASHPSLGMVSAAIDIPGAFTATVPDTNTTQYSSETMLKVNIRIDDPGNTENYYVIEVLKQRADIAPGAFFYDGKWWPFSENIDLYYQLASQNIFVELRIDTTYNNSFVRKPLYTDDVNMDNVVEKGIYNRNRRVFLKDNTFNGTSYATQVYIPYDSLSYSIFERGKVILLVKSVPENYFRFLKAYEGFSDAGGFSTFSQPVKIEGNVKNGVGMIGGAYIVRVPLFFDESF